MGIVVYGVQVRGLGNIAQYGGHRAPRPSPLWLSDLRPRHEVVLNTRCLDVLWIAVLPGLFGCLRFVFWVFAILYYIPIKP